MRALMALLALLFLPASVSAQTWPAKPVRIVVPFPAGGVADVLARGLQADLQAALGQPVLIDNKPGAGETGDHESAAQRNRLRLHVLLLRFESGQWRAAQSS